MLAIKLQRIGKKHQPSYRFVVAVKKSKMAAPPVEDLGSYNPSTKIAAIKNDRVAYWLKVGAQPTVTVHNLLVKQWAISKPKLAVKMKKAAVKEAVSAVETVPVAESAPASEPPATETVTT